MREIPRQPLFGSYRITESGRTVGREEWKLFRDGDRIVLRSRILREFPEPTLENLRLELDPGWTYRSLVIILQGEGGYGRTYEGVARGDRWRAQVTTADGGIERWEFPWDPSRELDYRSPLFNGITLKRLGLAEGQAATPRVLLVEPGSYAPREVEQRYTREEDDHVTVAAGRFHAPRYRYEAPATGARGTLWTDLRDTVLRFDGWFELVEYGEE